jgi:membrane protease YdiL (CAAX protease family)
MAGYFICFWPGDHPVRRISCLVFLPAIAGLALNFSRLVYFTAPTGSVLESAGSAASHRTSWAFWMLRNLPSGFQVSLLGLLLIAIFTSRLAFGIAALPLALPGSPVSQTEDSGSWRRLQILTFVLVGPVFLPSVLLAFVVIGIPVTFYSRVPSYIQSPWFSRLSSIAEIVVVLGIGLAIVGQEGRRRALSLIRVPRLNHVLLALAFPIGIGVFISVGQYLFDRAQWAVRDFGKFAPPQFGAYFELPDPWLLLMIFSALFEEVIFRGLIQERFVQRYGRYRGIFLVGIVWAAFHFFSDFSFSRSVGQGALLTISFRIFMCVSLSFVLAWLTLQSGSVLPAGIAHGFYNVLVRSDFGLPFLGKDTVRVALWALLAYVLFRYWPVQVEDSPEAVPSVANPEPAV